MDKLEKMHGMEWIQEKVRESRYQITEHVIRSLTSKALSIADIESVLLYGNIIEEHFHDSRGTSYLVCGLSDNKPIHVLCSFDRNDWLVIILAYIPSQPVWATPLKRNIPGGNNMNEQLKSCFFCGENIKEITIGNFDYRLEGQLYVIKKVPAGLCQGCGEKYVETGVARTINALIDSEEFTGTETVDVIEYRQNTG